MYRGNDRLQRVDDMLDTYLQDSPAERTEQILRQNSQLTPQIRPMVQIADALRELGATPMPAPARAAVQARLRQAVVSKRRRRTTHVITGRFGPTVMRAAAWAAVLIALVGAGVSGLSFAATRALPGDPLYSWRQRTERILGSDGPSQARAAAGARGVADAQVAELVADVSQGQPLAANAAAKLRQAYAAALQQSMPAPPSERGALLVQLETLSAAHAQVLETLARRVEGPDRAILVAAADAAREVAADARAAQEPGDAAPSSAPAP